LPGQDCRTGTPDFPQLIRGPKKHLTRRANQGHVNIIARIVRARAEKSAAGFLFEKSQSDGGRTSRRHIS